MTRKTYIKKVRALAVAIAQHPTSPVDYTSGDAQKSIVSKAKNVPGHFGSYTAAWNCEAMVWARRFYLGENV